MKFFYIALIILFVHSTVLFSMEKKDEQTPPALPAPVAMAMSAVQHMQEKVEENKQEANQCEANTTSGFRQRIRHLSSEDLEEDDGKLDPSVIYRKDRRWRNTWLE